MQEGRALALAPRVPQRFGARPGREPRRSRPSGVVHDDHRAVGPQALDDTPQRRHLVEHRNDRPERAASHAASWTERSTAPKHERDVRRRRRAEPWTSTVFRSLRPGPGLREAEISRIRLGEVRQRHRAGAGDGERRRGGPEPAQARMLADQRGRGGQARPAARKRPGDEVKLTRVVGRMARPVR